MTDDHSETGTGILDVGEREVPYRIEREDVAHVRLAITPEGGVLITLPRAEAANPIDILRDNRRWIETRLETEASAADECGLDLTEARNRPILFGTARTLESDSAHTTIHLSGNELRLPAEYTYPTIHNWLCSALCDKLRGTISGITDTLDVPYDGLRLDSELNQWSTYATDGTVRYHPRGAILPPDLREFVLFRELLFYKEAINNRSHWGELVEQYDRYEEFSDRVLGYWLLSHSNTFWNRLANAESTDVDCQ